MKIRPGISFCSLSDIGCQRENNEDCCGYWEPADQEEFLRKGRLAIIADGMGGHEGGQEASRIAVETVREVYAESTDYSLQGALLVGLKTAHSRILQYGMEHAGLEGMGTTCTAIALRGAELFYAHIGDSRLYLIREQQIFRITRDHSYVNRLVETGVIRSEQAETHPHRNVLMAALGAGTDITPEVPVTPIEVEEGDILLLCTDGLWGLLGDAEIQQAVTSNAPEPACRKLVQIAKQRGGPDNITVMVIQVTE